MVKNPLVNAGDTRDIDLIPRLGRSPEGVHGNPLQYSCKELDMNEQLSTHKRGDRISQSSTRETESVGDTL